MRPLGSSGPWGAGRITPRATALLAPNASWMTLDGTNSWLLAEPGADVCVVVDPGPDDPAHLDALVGEHGLNVDGQVLATRGELGYVLTDVSGTLSPDLLAALRALPETVRLTCFGRPRG